MGEGKDRQRGTERHTETTRQYLTRENLFSSDTEKSYNSNLAFLVSPGVSQAVLPRGILSTSRGGAAF